MANSLGVYCGGNLTLSSFCPKIICKIPLDKLSHACYSLLMFDHSSYTLTTKGGHYAQAVRALLRAIHAFDRLSILKRLSTGNNSSTCPCVPIHRHGGREYTRGIVTPLASAFVWWFAVLSPSGEIVFSEHRNKEACETTRKAYARVPHLTVTTCQNNQQTTKETRHGWKS